MSYSSKTALVAQHAIQFNLEVELENIILVAFRYFEFLHSQFPMSTGRNNVIVICKDECASRVAITRGLVVQS